MRELPLQPFRRVRGANCSSSHATFDAAAARAAAKMSVAMFKRQMEWKKKRDGKVSAAADDR